MLHYIGSYKERLKSVLTQLGAVAPVVRLCSSSQPEIQAAAVGVINVLSGHAEASSAIANSGQHTLLMCSQCVLCLWPLGPDGEPAKRSYLSTPCMLRLQHAHVVAHLFLSSGRTLQEEYSPILGLDLSLHFWLLWSQVYLLDIHVSCNSEDQDQDHRVQGWTFVKLWADKSGTAGLTDAYASPVSRCLNLICLWL